MPCLLVLLVAAFPRIVILWLYFMTTYLDRAYQSLIVLVLGFIFLPVTTIVYAWMINEHHPLQGGYLIALVVCALFDLGVIGHGEHRRRGR